MALSVITSAAGHQRVACGLDWLKARAPAEEVLIMGSTLIAANEIARSLARAKGASFGYYRMTLGQLSSTLARQAFRQAVRPLSSCVRDEHYGLQKRNERDIRRLALQCLHIPTA